MDKREWDAGTQLDRTDPELFDFNSEVGFLFPVCVEFRIIICCFGMIFFKGCCGDRGDCGSQHGESSQAGFALLLITNNYKELLRP